MSFDPPIRRMTVEAFRGFRDRQEFNLTASAVIVAGPNGTGKTSFFDAIQSCLLGSIERLEGLRSRRSVEHIVNQYRLNNRALVELEFVVRDRRFTLRRTGDHRSSTLEFIEQGRESAFGDDAMTLLAQILVPDRELTLEMALTTSGLMQQDVMRAVLEAKPADRYRHISTVLGLGALEDFEDAAKELAAEAKRRADAARGERDSLSGSLSEARARLAEAEQRLQTLPQVEALRAETLSALRGAPPVLSVDTALSLDTPTEARELVGALGELADRLETFNRRWTETEGTRRSLASEPTSGDVQAAASARDAAQAAVAAASDRSTDVEARLASAAAVGEELARLAALAIPMLTDHCPVCGQRIDPAHIEQELRERASDTQTMLALQDELREARTQVAISQASAREADARLGSLSDLRSRWEGYRSEVQAVEALFSALVSTEAPVRVSATSTNDLATSAAPVLDFLRLSRRRVLEFINTLEQGLDRGAVDRALSEVRSFTDALELRTHRLEQESQREQRLRALADATVAARVEVTEQRFRAVQPLVADIFSRLDPHPAFKTIEFELDTYYRRGATSPIVRDLVEGVSADPLMVFSTSQANIAALSYFLAMGWSAGERSLPFVLLDDPVQSMDDVNVLGFADLCRHLRKGRQLIISTHERRLARLLERKLAPRATDETTVIIEFLGWDRSGPSVEQREAEPQLLVDPIRVVQAAS